MADAKKAGLWTKQGTWSQYPKRMLELRARSYALRGAYADALLGFHAREEVEDYTDVTAHAVVREEPRRGRMRSVAPSIDFNPPDAPDPVEPVTSAHPENLTTPVAGEDSEPVIVPEVQDAPKVPTVDDLREAVVYAGRAIDGGIKAVIGQLAAHLGYCVTKADDVLTVDRARAIAFARAFAGLEC